MELSRHGGPQKENIAVEAQYATVASPLGAGFA